jgi:hypothetical protein
MRVVGVRFKVDGRAVEVDWDCEAPDHETNFYREGGEACERDSGCVRIELL